MGRCWACRASPVPGVKRRWHKGKCPACTNLLADQGTVTCSGLELLQGGVPSDGFVGPVQLGAVALDPPAAKWKDFSAAMERGEVLQRRTTQGWKAVRPSDLQACSREHKKRARVELGGLAIAGCNPCVSAVCEFNAAKAVISRVFTKPKYTPKAGAFDLLSRHTDQLLPGFVSDAPEPMSVDAWLDSMPSRRRKALKRAALNVLRDVWRADWTKFKAFVKTEKLPGFCKEASDEVSVLQVMIDRLIQGPADEAHVLLGPHLKPLCHHLKQVWHNRNPIFYASTSVDKLDSWLEWAWQPGTMAVMADYSKFDNSHSDESWNWVEETYRRIGLQSRDSRIAKILKAWRRPVGILSGSGWALRYKADTMNASGRDDTALANALLNGGAMFLSLAAALAKVDVLDLTIEHVATALSTVRLAVCGDDTLAFVPSQSDVAGFRSLLSANVASFGFTAEGDKLIISENPFDFVFLGMRPYPTRAGWRFGKTLGRALYKFGWKLDPKDVDIAAWYAGECTQTITTQAHVPVLSDIARAFLKQHAGGKICSVSDWRECQNVAWGPSDPYDETAVRYVEQGYGLYPGEVAAFLGELANMTFPAVSSHHCLRRFVAHDDL